jgi:hypothetical protein
MRLAAFLFAVVAVPGVAQPLFGQATTSPSEKSQAAAAKENPLAGNWVANLSKSKRHSNHQFQSATLQFTVIATPLTQSVNIKSEESVITFQADGEASDSTGSWHDERGQVGRLASRNREEGQPNRRSRHAEVSADGKTLTATVSGRTEAEHLRPGDCVRS